MRQQIEYTVRNEKRAVVAGQALEIVRAAGSDFAAAAVSAGLEVRQTGAFGRADFVPGVGRAGKFTATAFALQSGAVSEIITQGNGAYLLHLSERIAADNSLLEQQRPAIEAQLLETRQREALNSWYAQLYERAEIQDYRHNFFYSF